MHTNYASSLRRRLYHWLLREQRTAERASRLRPADAQTVPLAMADALTGLPGPDLLEDRVQQAIEHCRRRRACCAMLRVELDQFASVNDSLGAVVGDAVLCTIAQRLRSALRLEDTVSRVGADEFVVVLKELRRAEDAIALAHKMIEILSRPVALGEHELRMASWVGVALFPDHGDEARQLLGCAARAAGRARESRRSRVSL